MTILLFFLNTLNIYLFFHLITQFNSEKSFLIFNFFCLKILLLLHNCFLNFIDETNSINDVNGIMTQLILFGLLKGE